jgi:SAM-dependent methyltransferase
MSTRNEGRLIVRTKIRRPLTVLPLLISICFFAAKEFPDSHALVRPPLGIPGQQLEISQEEKDANELQPPDKVMDAAGVRAGLVIGEVGAGKGRYTVHLARRVGPEGKVYANDIDEKCLSFLRDRCRKQGLPNIETVLGTTDDPGFPKGQLDMVFMIWVYHHLERPIALLRNLIPGLKPAGTVVIVDPDPIKNKGGKSPENRSPDQIRREAGEAGFEVVRVETFLKIDNIYVLKVRQAIEELGPREQRQWRDHNERQTAIAGVLRSSTHDVAFHRKNYQPT